MLNILIADDENKVCQLIKSLVDWEALDMRVIATAENGIDALEKIRELNPDIAITDIRMPGYDGLEPRKPTPERSLSLSAAIAISSTPSLPSAMGSTPTC